MNETMTMAEAAPTASGNPTNPLSGQAAATADALYGNTQRTDQGSPPAVVDATKPAQPVGDKSVDPAQAKGEAEAKTDAKQEAPAQYEFKSPDGQGFDPEAMKVYAEVAKELNLSQDSAQKILDRMGPTVAQRQAAAIQKVQAEWAEASRTDKEFGGDTLMDNLGVAKKALDSFGTPELRSLLNDSGLGNHPEIIRFMVRAGRAISEDRFVGGSAPSPSRGSVKDFNSAAAALYSNQPQL
jgi:hypothetical protein